MEEEEKMEVEARAQEEHRLVEEYENNNSSARTDDPWCKAKEDKECNEQMLIPDETR